MTITFDYVRREPMTKFPQENEVRKSISVEITWGVRFKNDDEVERFMENLAKEVSQSSKSISDRK